MSAEVVTISRSKLYPVPGRAARFAWKWVYEVTVPGEPYAFSGETLSWANGIAKSKANGRRVVRLWESKSDGSSAGKAAA